MVSKKEPIKDDKQKNNQDKFKKPFGFCCDKNSPDSDTRYNQRKPPFTSSLSNVVLHGGGPDLKFRVKDIFVTKSIPRSGTQKSSVKSNIARLGSCRWCRGPINYYLEDEISVAQEMFAKQKQDRFNQDVQKDATSARRKILKLRKRKGGILKPKQSQTEDENNSETAKNDK
ncbi:uncharacterized protein LOC117183141 [Belonocnema kinseyi]|uniref:uncharacterized protein LOC117183141 n=1 Tax=Belonocnema kinseyi TaxID=2817044 RepID=UPI00143D1CB8|nr:uncharacterized protein LOC117183141 [Belonocnema kinseyi]XP_033232235.1 uncharacterized protein LOC117183141 [Belonocnema kinseyi]